MTSSKPIRTPTETKARSRILAQLTGTASSPKPLSFAKQVSANLTSSDADGPQPAMFVGCRWGGPTPSISKQQAMADAVDNGYAQFARESNGECWLKFNEGSQAYTEWRRISQMR